MIKLISYFLFDIISHSFDRKKYLSNKKIRSIIVEIDEN